MANRLALILGVSILATACSSQDTDAPETADVEAVDTTAANTAPDTTDMQDVAAPAGEADATAANDANADIAKMDLCLGACPC